MLCRLHGNGQLKRAPLLHLPWAEVPCCCGPCVTVEGTERNRWRLQPAARGCSWWLRARLQRRELLTECTLAGPVGSEPAALPHPAGVARVHKSSVPQLPEHVAPAGLYLVGSADETGC